MSTTKSPGLLNRASKQLTSAPIVQKTQETHDDEDSDDDGKAAEDIGRTFVYRNTLTPAESAALELSRRDRNEDDIEQFPLSLKQRNATYGDIRQPLHSQQLGPDSEALCIAVTSSGNALAVGCRHGTVQLFHPQTLELMDTIKMAELAASSGTSGTSGSGATTGATGRRSTGTGGAGGLVGSPGEGVVTSLAFRPDLPGSRMQNVLLAAQGETVVHMHAGTRRVIQTNTEEDNRINALAMRPDGAMFASAGSDFVVRAYDEATCALSRTLDHGDGVSTTGHTNVVFSLAWHPDDPQILLSGGWDNHVLVWDLRVHRSVSSIPGPHICGDALDVQPGGTHLVLTGSWRSTTPLQLWDMRSCRLLTNLPWWQPEQSACLPYAARFGSGAAAGTVVAGGAGSQPMVRLYKLNAPGIVDLQFTVRLQRPVHALALVPGAAATSGARGGGAQSTTAAAPAAAPAGLLAVCCDEEVHTVGLSARA